MQYKGRRERPQQQMRQVMSYSKTHESETDNLGDEQMTAPIPHERHSVIVGE